jgi:hypothetical protein
MVQISTLSNASNCEENAFLALQSIFEEPKSYFIHVIEPLCWDGVEKTHLRFSLLD